MVTLIDKIGLPTEPIDRIVAAVDNGKADDHVLLVLSDHSVSGSNLAYCCPRILQDYATATRPTLRPYRDKEKLD